MKITHTKKIKNTKKSSKRKHVKNMKMLLKKKKNTKKAPEKYQIFLKWKKKKSMSIIWNIIKISVSYEIAHKKITVQSLNKFCFTILGQSDFLFHGLVLNLSQLPQIGPFSTIQKQKQKQKQLISFFYDDYYDNIGDVDYIND